MPQLPKKQRINSRKNEIHNNKRKINEDDGESKSRKRQKTEWLRDIRAILRSAGNKLVLPQVQFKRKKSKTKRKDSSVSVTENNSELNSIYEKDIKDGGPLSASTEECCFRNIEYNLGEEIVLEKVPEVFQNCLNNKNSDTVKTIIKNIPQKKDANFNRVLNDIQVIDCESLTDSELIESQDTSYERLPDYKTLIDSKRTSEIQETMADCSSDLTRVKEKDAFYFGSIKNKAIDCDTKACSFIFAQPINLNGSVKNDNTENLLNNSTELINKNIDFPPEFRNTQNFYSDRRDGETPSIDDVTIENENETLTVTKGYYDLERGAYIDPSTLQSQCSIGNPSALQNTWGSIKNLICRVSGQKRDDLLEGPNENN